MPGAHADRLSQPLERDRLIRVCVQVSPSRPHLALGIRLRGRAAAATGSEPGRRGLRRGRKEPDVGTPRPPAGAGGPAEDPGGRDGIHELPVGRGVAVQHGGPAPVFALHGLGLHAGMVAPGARGNHSNLALELDPVRAGIGWRTGHFGGTLSRWGNLWSPGVVTGLSESRLGSLQPAATVIRTKLLQGGWASITDRRIAY